jgi:hypothetical protein
MAEKARRTPPAPPAEANVTKQEAVRLLAREIGGLQRKGYKLEQIVASFRGDGLDLSTATMKTYLSRAKSSRSRRRDAPKQAQIPTKAATPLTEKGTQPLTKEDTPSKSGKDAFLVKDKDSY